MISFNEFNFVIEWHLFYDTDIGITKYVHIEDIKNWINDIMTWIYYKYYVACKLK